jgi:hypothetical protein
MAEVLKALEMFNELVQRGYIVPVSEHPSLKEMTIYRSVPSTMTGGTGTGSYSTTGAVDAELDLPVEGNSEHTGSR